MLDDLLADATAVSLDMAADGIKQLAYAGQISGQRASAWRREGKGNPLHDLTLVVYRLMRIGQRPFHLIAHLMVTINQAMLGLSDEALIRRFWTLTEEECAAECAENLAVARFQADGDLRALERADQEEAERQMERAAVSRELRRRGLDPRKR